MINDPCLEEDALIKIFIKSHTVVLCSAMPRRQDRGTLLDLCFSSKRTLMSQGRVAEDVNTAQRFISMLCMLSRICLSDFPKIRANSLCHFKVAVVKKIMP